MLDATRIDLSGLSPEARVGLCVRHPLQDGGQGPAMQLVAGGLFLMGSAEGEVDAHADERPRHEVRIGKAFAIGRFPVTFDDYDRFCDATGRRKPADEGWGRGTRPVINVGWDDANANCQWLSDQCGVSYRLPTEAEWEYACRAGTRTRWSFGDEEGDLDDHAWSEANADGRTHPVGEKRPNDWGLYDCCGNVWEWVEDYWHGSYDGAPDGGEAWREENGGDPGLRVLRGGSGGDRLDGVRSTCRFRSPPSGRDHFVGFRVLCASPFERGSAP
jgi:formylglycine-generating enzyme required for sulfatase activity